MSVVYSWKFSWRKCEIHFLRDNLGVQKVLESAFFRLSKNLKFKILATMVPPPGYAGFITNLPFWATRRLERMITLFKFHISSVTFYFFHRPLLTIHGFRMSVPVLILDGFFHKKFRVLGVVEYALRCTRILTSESVLWMCSDIENHRYVVWVCHNYSCAFSRSVKNHLFQKGIMYISLDAEFEAD